jgi:hypothetical protein
MRRLRSRPAGSSGFVRSDEFLLVAVAAEKFGCRPSQMVKLSDPVLALDFDLAAAARLLEARRAATEPEDESLAGANVNRIRW